MRKGNKVKYIGNKELYKTWNNGIYTVLKKEGSFVTLNIPVVYLGGEIHTSKTSIPVSEVEMWTTK